MTWKRSYLTITIIGALLVIVNVVFLLSNTSWIITDDSMFLDWTFIGKRIPFRSFDEARFSPLIWQDFNLMIPFRDWALPYYIWSSIKFLLGLWVLWRAGTEIRKRIRSSSGPDYRYNVLSIIIFIFVFNSIAYYQSYVDIVYPEPNLILVIPLYVLLYIINWEKNSLLIYVTQIAIAVVILLSKEMGFALLGTFSFIWLLTGWKFLAAKEKAFHFAILAICLCFLLFYYFGVYLTSDSLYIPPNKLNPSVLLLILFWFVLNPIFFLIPVLIVYAIKRKLYVVTNRTDVLFISLLTGAMSLLGFYFVLGYFAPYYLSPVYPILFLLAIYLISDPRVIQRLTKKSVKRYLMAFVLLLFIYNMGLSVKNWDYWNDRRKNDFAQLHEALDYYEEGYELIYLDIDADIQEVTSSIGGPMMKYLCDKRQMEEYPEYPSMKLEDLVPPYKKMVVITQFDDYLEEGFEVESLSLLGDSVDITHGEWANILVFH